LGGPDEASVVAVCTFACIGGVQVGDPGLSLQFWDRQMSASLIVTEEKRK
jgi:hypothetical protein